MKHLVIAMTKKKKKTEKPKNSKNPCPQHFKYQNPKKKKSLLPITH